MDERGIHLNIVTEGIDTSSPTGRLVFTILSAVAEMEASLISERTKQALAMSENKGGRPRLDGEIRLKVIELYRTSEYTVEEIARTLSISESSVYRVLRADKENENNS